MAKCPSERVDNAGELAIEGRNSPLAGGEAFRAGVSAWTRPSACFSDDRARPPLSSLLQQDGTTELLAEPGPRARRLGLEFRSLNLRACGEAGHRARPAHAPCRLSAPRPVPRIAGCASVDREATAQRLAQSGGLERSSVRGRRVRAHRVHSFRRSAPAGARLHRGRRAGLAVPYRSRRPIPLPCSPLGLTLASEDLACQRRLPRASVPIHRSGPLAVRTAPIGPTGATREEVVSALESGAMQVAGQERRAWSFVATASAAPATASLRSVVVDLVLEVRTPAREPHRLAQSYQPFATPIHLGPRDRRTA